MCFFFFFQAEDGIRAADVTGVQTCALPISVRDRLPYVQAAFPQRSLHAVDLGQRRALAARRRADVQPLAGRAQRVDIRAAQCLQAQALGGYAGLVSVASSSARSRRRFAPRRSIGSVGASSWCWRACQCPAAHPAPRNPPMIAYPAAVGSRITITSSITGRTSPIVGPRPGQNQGGTGLAPVKPATIDQETDEKQGQPPPLVARRGALSAVRPVLAGHRRRRLWGPRRRDREARLPVLARRRRHLAVPDDAVAGRGLGLRHLRLPGRSS